MAAPQTRTLDDDQIRDLRELRRTQGGEIAVFGNTTIAMKREGQTFRMFTAVCGDADSFDPEAGEYLVRCRMQDYMDGNTSDGVPICAQVADMFGFE